MGDESCGGESSLDMTVNAGFLPREVLVKIFSYCSFNDLVKSFQFVCHWWQDASRERCLWKHFSYEPRGVTKEEIIYMFRICPQLKSVNLMSVTMDEEIFMELIFNCLYLEVLYISWDAVYNLINLAIIQPLTNIKTLKLSRRENVIIDFEHVNTIFPNLEHLEFDVLFYRLKDLVNYLQEKRHTMHTLSLTCCSDDGNCILPYTEACVKLKTLSLRNLCDSVESIPFDKVHHLKNITSLTFHYSDVGAESDDGTVFKFFPNIVDLKLYVCTQTSGNFLYELSLSCPTLRKLTVSNEWHGLGSVLQDHNLKQLSSLKSLTHLTIRFNAFITDEGVKYFEGIPSLMYLDLYDCEQVTVQCLKVVCSFSTLEVFKFDLQYNDLPIDLTTDYVKNKNLQLRFYNCNDLSVLQHLKKEFLNVGVVEMFNLVVGMNVRADILPQDVLLKIFSYCSYDDLVVSVQFVCTWWQEVSRQRCLWKHIVYRPSSKETIDILKISPRLQALDLSKCNADRCLLEKLKKYCPELRRLHVSSDVFYPLFELKFTVFPNIKVLILTQGINDFRAWQYLGDFFPNLEHVEVHDFYLTRNDLVSFLKKMQHQLHTLCIPCRTLDNFCSIPYLSVCSKLETLSLLRLCDDLKHLHIEEVNFLRRISFLTFKDVQGDSLSGNMIIFSWFPNLINLELYDSNQPSDAFFQIVAKSCPELQKVTLSASFYFSILHDFSIKNLQLLKKLTSLTILYNGCITSDCVSHLQLIPHLTYLELYACKKLTGQCLKVICGFNKLQVLKFDLRYKERLIDLSASDVKNRNLKLMFYRCRDISKLEYLRKQHLSVCILADRLGKSVLLL